MAVVETPAGPLLDKKRTIITLQWLVTVVSSFLMLFSAGEVSADFRAHGLTIFLFITTLALYRVPGDVFHHRFFDGVLMLFDTLVIVAAITLKSDVSWDLFLFYFFILFLAAIGATMLKIVLGSVVVSLVYIALLFQQGKSLAQIGSEGLVRIAFLFSVSILYGYLTENVNKEKQRAETAEQRERLKMDLVAALAHDIKNPLGIIMGYAEMLRDLLVNRPEEKEKVEGLERIEGSARRIVTLVTGFIEASKAESGKVEIVHRPISVNRLLQEVSRQQETELERRGLKLELTLDEKLPEILGDEAQLDRVFWNLIGNAIKFTRSGGKITVTSTCEDNHVCIAVKDTGIGIPRDEIPLLFSQFRRLKGAEKIEGSGLGLFIVKTIIEAHRGTVQAESDEQGSTFRARIPIRP